MTRTLEIIPNTTGPGNAPGHTVVDIATAAPVAWFAEGTHAQHYLHWCDKGPKKLVIKAGRESFDVRAENGIVVIEDDIKASEMHMGLAAAQELARKVMLAAMEVQEGT